MKQVKKYIAIGHWGKDKDATYSVATTGYSLKDARRDYVNNDFVAYVIISEERLNQIKGKSYSEICDEVMKMTKNYRRWEIIVDYLNQCMDIMEDHLANVCMD